MKIREWLVGEDVQIVLDEFDKRGKEMLDVRWARVIQEVFEQANAVEKILLKRKKVKLQKEMQREKAHEMLMLRLLGQDEKEDSKTQPGTLSPYFQQVLGMQAQQQQAKLQQLQQYPPTASATSYIQLSGSTSTDDPNH